METPFTRAKKMGTARQIFGTVPHLPVPRLPPGGSLGTPKVLSTGAKLRLGPIRLHVENWECHALKSSVRCQKFGVPCGFFLARVDIVKRHWRRGGGGGGKGRRGVGLKDS